MAPPTVANYVFLPWVRQGFAAGIETVDQTEDQAGYVLVDVALQVNSEAPITQSVRLYGPGDVIGLDPQQVVRTEPRHLATDFEPNYFPAVDFDRPDLPWLFTPGKANAGQLRPWICLVVVRKQEGVTLRVDRALPLPVLDINAPADPARELPDLSESWAWAHAQVAGSAPDAAKLSDALAGDPALTVSRLICPRRLDPLTDYLACVVPAFELGRKAGLGLPFQRDAQRDEEKELHPAWTTTGEPPLLNITLPVYYHWEFRTGAGRDFETLAALLTPSDLRGIAGIGRRPVDISQPGLRITPPLPSGTTLELEGALRVDPATEWTADVPTPFQTALKQVLDAPAQAALEAGQDPVVAPPIYGSWQAARHTVHVTPPPAGPRPWLDELNLDPRHRAVAALGTAVVQAQQEQLMASAWEQFGDLERINQMKRQAQLGRAVNTVYHTKHFGQFSEESLLKVLAAAQSRIFVDSAGAGNVTTRTPLSQRISESPVPSRAVSAPLRRLTSARGVVSRRFQKQTAKTIAIVARLDAGPIVKLQKKSAGVVTTDQIADELNSAKATQGIKDTIRWENAAKTLDTTLRLADFMIAHEGIAPPRSLLTFKEGVADSPSAQAFKEAAKAHHAGVDRLLAAVIPARGFKKLNVGVGDTKKTLLAQLNPAITFKARIEASITVEGSAPAPADPLEPILESPEFRQPMYEALRDISQDFLFPGLESVPANTVTVLHTNPQFVESFLVGLNAEMTRELLWRNFPTDQRGTYFRQFWDTSAGSDRPDIESIAQWGDRLLGHNTSTGEKLVLLVRGELLRQYPNSVIYAVAAAAGADGALKLSTDEKHPLFRGTLKPDVTFLGFDLTESAAIAGLGWFFVIQQQPTEPRFGLDAADFKKLQPLATWNDLSWRHLVETEDALTSLSHVSVATVLPHLDGADWNRNAAHQAYITLQRPVRIAIHATEMLS